MALANQNFFRSYMYLQLFSTENKKNVTHSDNFFSALEYKTQFARNLHWVGNAQEKQDTKN
jgi:hypothetical protein